MFDLVVLGATGYTGSFVVREIASIDAQHLKWAIAGRNASSLGILRDSLKDGAVSALPDILLADVSEESSLLRMASRTKVVMNCVGPFRLLGEAVVQACIKGRAHYLDITGEPEFIERMHLTYHEEAKRAGVTILHAAAYDSVPCDLGVLEVKKALLRKGAIPSSIDMFAQLHSEGDYGVHYTTFQSAVEGFAHGHAQLDQIRRDLAKTRPALNPVGVPPQYEVSRLGFLSDERVKGWLVPYFVADPAVVRLSQTLELMPDEAQQRSLSPLPPVHFTAHLVMPTLYALILFKLYFAIFKWMVVRSWGRDLLLKHPKLFTYGIASKEGPTKKQREQTSFSQTFFGRGFSLHDAPSGPTMPDVSVTAHIHGADMGW